MDYLKFIVSNQKEESISIQRVKGGFWAYVTSIKILNASYKGLCCQWFLPCMGFLLTDLSFHVKYFHFLISHLSNFIS